MAVGVLFHPPSDLTAVQLQATYQRQFLDCDSTFLLGASLAHHHGHHEGLQETGQAHPDQVEGDHEPLGLDAAAPVGHHDHPQQDSPAQEEGQHQADPSPGEEGRPVGVEEPHAVHARHQQAAVGTEVTGNQRQQGQPEENGWGEPVGLPADQHVRDDHD